MKKVLTLVLCLAVAISFIGCNTRAQVEDKSSAPVADKPVAPAYPKITVPIATQPQMHGYLLQRAQNDGYYSQFGVTGEFQMYNAGGPMNEALAAEQWKIGGIGAAAVISCVRFNAKIVAAANYESEAHLIITRKDSDIMKTQGYIKEFPKLYGTPETIKGKTIISTVGSTLHYMAEKYVRAMGLEMTDVEILNMAPAAAIAAFKAGEGDILTTTSPFSWALDLEGNEYAVIGNITDVGGQVPSVLLASEKTVAEEPDAIVQTLAGFLKTVEVAKNDRNGTLESLKAFLEENGFEPNDEQLVFEYDTKPIFTIDEQLELFTPDSDGIAAIKSEFIEISKYLLSLGTITAEEQVKFAETAFDSSYLEKVAKLPEFQK